MFPCSVDFCFERKSVVVDDVAVVDIVGVGSGVVDVAVEAVVAVIGVDDVVMGGSGGDVVVVVVDFVDLLHQRSRKNNYLFPRAYGVR